MESWLQEVEPLTLKGQIAVPYTWWVGETGSRFLIALRDEGKILGNRCDSCNTVFVPPRKNCGRCFVDTGEWVELSDQGVVKAHTIVRFSHPLQPVEPPFAYAMIQLDGAEKMASGSGRASRNNRSGRDTSWTSTVSRSSDPLGWRTKWTT